MNDTEPNPPSNPSSAAARLRLRFVDHGGRLIRTTMMELVLLALCIFLAFQADGFLTLKNLLNVLRNVSMEGVIAFGMTMVIIAGEIDLSVGSVVACAGCLTAWLVQWMVGLKLGMGTAVTFGILASLAGGFGIGCLTGLLKTERRVPTFISTLAWMTVLRGLAGLITNGSPLTPFPHWYKFFGGGYVLGIPFPAILFLGTFFIIQFLMSFTSFGRSIYAVGGNTEAARLSGINVRMVKIMVMGLVSFLAAMSGIMVSSQILSGNPGAGVGWELDVISAVIIGGTSLLGGEGRIWGTFIGVIFLGVLVNGMTLLNVNEYWQLVVRRGLILAAVMINLAPAKKN